MNQTGILELIKISHVKEKFTEYGPRQERSNTTEGTLIWLNLIDRKKNEQ